MIDFPANGATFRDGDPLLAIRTEFRNVTPNELLGKPPTVLLGVSAAAATALAILEIETVFDLATSGVFSDAGKLVEAGSELRGPLYQHGSPTSDLVREVRSAGKQVAELQFEPIDVLQRIPEAESAQIGSALDATTVRDLALYPPYRAAKLLLNSVYFPDNMPGVDQERPNDLIPKSGEYATEKVQYAALVLDEIPLDDGEQLTDVTGIGFEPLDLEVLAQADAGFKKTAFGALLTFSQSWYAQGVTLGQLLHSTSLAPGESTRIAIIDWTRKSRAGETEIIDETDDLTNDQSHNRSITEVTKAVATEAQGDSCRVTSTATRPSRAHPPPVS